MTAPRPAVDAEASKRTSVNAAGVVGTNVNTGIGFTPVGPGGTSLTVTTRSKCAEASVPVGVTLNWRLGMSPLMNGGAVYVKDARPLAPVTSVRADNVPKSTTWPFARISTRSGTFGASCPLASRASMVINVCEEPSSERTSGLAVITIDRAIPDGPASGGGSTLAIVHPAATTAVISTNMFAKYLVMTCVPVSIMGCRYSFLAWIGVISEAHVDRRFCLHRVPHLIRSIERDFCDRRNKNTSAETRE